MRRHDELSPATLNPGNGLFRPGLLDKATAAGARLLGRVPSPLLRLLGTRRNDAGDVLDADVAASLLSLRFISSLDIVDVPPVHSRRIVEKEAYLASGKVRVAEVSDGEVAGVPVRVYLHEPASVPGPRPTLVYLHGGGWATGSLDSHDSACRSLCAGGGVTVVAVDFRLAPEHPYPAALEDTVAVVSALQEGTEGTEGTGGTQVGGVEVDTSRIVISGDSAGANLAAAACLWLRDNGRTQPAMQQLFAPVTDLSQRTASYREFGDGGFYLSAEQMDWYEHHYLGRSSDLTEAADPTDPLVSPMCAQDLSGLAPAYVAVAGFDPLRDEGEAYAGRLREAGVPVTLHRHAGLVHPFVNSVAVWKGARKAMSDAVKHMRTTLDAMADSTGNTEDNQPAPSVKDPELYERLREEGESKEKSARIANAAANISREEMGRRGGESGSYDGWTKNELYKRAQELGIAGRSSMNKGELIDALRDS